MNLAAALFANARQKKFIDIPALLYHDESISYAALDRLSNQAANLLDNLDVHSGERVLILLRDTPELIALFLGAVKAGVVPVVLSTRISREDVGHALGDSEAVAIFVEADLASLTEDAGGSGTSVHERSEFVARLNRADETFEPILRERDDTAFWVCSSGSTSRPKSVVHTHGGVTAANGFHREQLLLHAGTRIHCTSKLSFAYPLSNTFLGAMDVGASVVLYPDWHDPESLLQTIEHHSPEVVFSTPTLYRRVLHAATDGKRDLLGKVRAWVSAGEHLSEGVNDAWRAFTGNDILDCYGTSETLFLITATPLDARRPDSAGRAVPGAELQLRGPGGDALPPGKIGELYVRHPFLANGYANNPELTEQRFSGGWFATGDLFLYDTDGFWYFRGREDSRIKIAGQWVHLQDVENAVSEDRSVKEVAAVSAPDEDGLSRIALFVVCEPGAPQTQVADNVHQRLLQLPTHKRPRWLQFADALPRTNTGKIKRHELRPLVAMHADQDSVNSAD
ncbi:MAG: AMP-binding protein [Gammaproteobacteria bacterium]|nr:AMP-binding protein [Gammaproteobacteria bacterium]